MNLQDIQKTAKTIYVNHSGDGTFYSCDITLEIDGNVFKAEVVTSDNIEGAISLNGADFQYCLAEYMMFKFDDGEQHSLTDIILACFDQNACDEFMAHDKRDAGLENKHNQSLRVGG